MLIQDIKKTLDSCERPLDFFEDIPLDEITKKYRKYAKYCHPDLASDNLKKLAEETMKILNELYERALEEYEEGIYNITDNKVLYKKQKPIIEFDSGSKNYKFYKDLGCDDVSNIYEGLCDDKLIQMRIISDEVDNDLFSLEYELLRNLNHQSLPKIIQMVKLNRRNTLIYDKIPGKTIEEFIKYYGRLPGSHVAWILERMLSLIGYLHENKIVHGNIKPENIMIDSDSHNVYIQDYSLSINNANEENKNYKIVNEYFTPTYVTNSAKVIPNVDIYAVGKIGIMLLGGDIKRGAMPIDCEIELRTFIRKLIDEKVKLNDAWVLWDELISLRNKIYGTVRFQKLERKI